VALSGIDGSKEGPDWTADEVAVLVGSYFLMLAEERAGREYNKSEYRRSVIAAIGRKPGSIERKLQNVSAVLDEIGIPWIQGYKPLAHYQKRNDILVDAVDRELGRHQEMLRAGPVAPLRIPNEDDILIAPPPLLNSDPESRPAIPARRYRPRTDAPCPSRDFSSSGRTPAPPRAPLREE
jgi:hypothetical protein